ncbi:ATP-binding cassette domain-containing protein [Vibrio ponticus]|uniref:ATP-binding cassette domain-containing protein n=1 Tax=Vibrio ponticus TaxID=265668 RepID=A0A3N3DZW1_9VIBR|nr:ATP-binding cassette domain-containing protein [Vibrio ponticus]ROV59962.1 ATP-binding cassette domain-containing protein [Vibrio ponticus]
MTIVVRDLSFDYGRRPVLSNVSLVIEPGFNILLGPNGAGKSTLFSLLTGLYQTKKGEVGFGRLSLAKHRRAVLSQLGVVFQQSTLDLDLTVKQNLIYHACLHGLSFDDALQNITHILNDLQLLPRLNDRVRTLNGGHRRRLEIARAMMHCPRYLLLDEATVGLDNESRSLILQHIRHQCQRQDLCVLWTTHLMDEVESSDSLIVLSQGLIKAHDTAGKLYQQHQVGDVYQLYRQLTQSMEIT